MSSLLQPFQNSFIITLVGVDAKLFRSDVVQNATSTFEENGADLLFEWQTSLLPDTDQMCENAMIESTIYIQQSSDTGALTVTAQNQDETVLDTVMIQLSGTPTIWDAFIWDAAVWDGVGTFAPLFPQQPRWTQPIVFRRLSIDVSGACASRFEIGRMHLRYEMLGYLQFGGGSQGGGTVTTPGFVLLEDGSSLLLEDGANLLLE